jgi:hypothetical protein
MSEQIVDPFFVVLNNGTRIVQGAYPSALFLEADSPWVQGADTYDWRLVYGIPADPPRRAETVFLYSKNFQFTAPQLVHDLFLESDPIPLPLRFGIIRAAAIKNQAGYTGDITATTVRWQVTHPATEEPQYIFRVPSIGLFVKVGINSEKVTTTPIPPPQA